MTHSLTYTCIRSLKRKSQDTPRTNETYRQIRFVFFFLLPFALLDRSRYNISIYGYELLYNLLLFLTSSCQITYIYVQDEVRKRDKAPRRDATLRSLLSRTTVLLIAFHDRSSSLRRFFFFFFASPLFVQFTENLCVVSASLLP